MITAYLPSSPNRETLTLPFLMLFLFSWLVDCNNDDAQEQLLPNQTERQSVDFRTTHKFDLNIRKTREIPQITDSMTGETFADEVNIHTYFNTITFHISAAAAV